ncbi:M23 family metallopeptidase [Sphingomonas sp. S2-65]|uniref:M23 family metallopeptidase n=1 Tax=Sphingomonas sp. S2-65 TaxID=2903960 RepID=UPI001F31429B|nr:M23 family metallopeptidase [Sphingomonas sp. S2-65]UYY58879.1 M23 family metallopeptidase [Sphingomonas sp. S2-65]
MTRGRWIGWGLAALLLASAVGYLSLVRITVLPADQARPAVAVPQRIEAEPVDRQPLVLPVAGVTRRQLSDTWGQSRGGGAREHHAIDILAPRGTPVLAAASGRVEKIFESGNGGHTVYVRLPDARTVHYYAHLDRYLTAEGQVVRQGQAIATVGDTGSAAGTPHLHFEIKTMRPGERWWQGDNVNPYPLLMRGGD